MSHANAPADVEEAPPSVSAGRRRPPSTHVAAEAGVSRQCLSKWHRRWRAHGQAGLVDRSSARPAHSPDQVPPRRPRPHRAATRERRLGPARIAAELRSQGVAISASGVHRVLVRLGINRLRDLGPAHR